MRAACWLNVLLLASVVLVGQHAVVSATELEGFDDLDDEPILQPPIATDASPEVSESAALSMWTCMCNVVAVFHTGGNCDAAPLETMAFKVALESSHA